MRKLSYFIIFSGLVIMLFPTLRQWHDDWRQQRLLLQAEQALSAGASRQEEAAAAYDSLSRLFLQEAAAETIELEKAERESSPAVISKEEPPSDELLAAAIQPTVAPKQPPIALISIDKINLRLPVLEGATQENMKSAAAHMKETTPLGEIGNAAIAGHRARGKGRLFNRLNELDAGDEIVLEMATGKITYTVYKVLRVDPSDVSVLNRNKVDSILTLITCDPVIDPVFRLIVQAKRS
ncbi:MAG: hypothetical protein K0R57_4189 [Paenibacillaceae bacterium]|jgi:sortase A|nr:hypothetical protein [Paenibacillaceae bacterium]